MKNKNYIHHVQYLRNSIAYDHDFWYTWVKLWYLQLLFSFFDIFILWAVRRGGGGGKTAKKWPRMNKKLCLLHFIPQEPYIIWFWFMVHMSKRIISPTVFYIFSKFWFLVSIVGKKSKKWPEMTKKLCLLHSISE